MGSVAWSAKGSISILWILCLFIAVGLAITFGDKGLLELYRVKEEQCGILRQNERLLQENEDLIREIHRLKCDKYIEDTARKELGLIKEGEVIYQFEKDIADSRGENRDDHSP